MNRSLVYPKLPNAGLGNMLLVWANALVFAHINEFPIIAPKFNKIKLGPYLRGELDKRYYNQISMKDGYLPRLYGEILLLTKTKKFNPLIEKVNTIEEITYVFNTIPHWSDYFNRLRDFQPMIRSALLQSISNQLLQSIETQPPCKIAIHVRLSDFRPLNLGEDFAKVGLVRTPIDWYIRCLQSLREIAGYTIPATIFSDGHNYEIESLLSIENVIRTPKQSAIADLVYLSRSQILITSAGSTFSQWASFLGQQPTISHPDHFHTGVFPCQVREKIFEGGYDPDTMQVPDLLRQNVLDIFS